MIFGHLRPILDTRVRCWTLVTDFLTVLSNFLDTSILVWTPLSGFRHLYLSMDTIVWF